MIYHDLFELLILHNKQINFSNIYYTKLNKIVINNLKLQKELENIFVDVNGVLNLIKERIIQENNILYLFGSGNNRKTCFKNLIFKAFPELSRENIVETNYIMDVLNKDNVIFFNKSLPSNLYFPYKFNNVEKIFKRKVLNSFNTLN